MKSPLQNAGVAAGHFLLGMLLATVALLPSHAATQIPVGVARVDISPENPVPLMGYAARANRPAPSENAQRIYARALAFGTAPDAAILITIDNCILPASIAEKVRHRLQEKGAIKPEQLTLSVTHTHSAPCLTGAAPNIFGREINAVEQAAIDTYTQSLIEKLEQIALAALADRKPAILSWGKGTAGFAKNRRAKGGPVDHELPILRVSSPDGKLRAVFVSYACHCTTLGGEFNAVHGDWAGVAAEVIEKEHPGAIAAIAIGCGADANPDPRGSLEQAIRHGEEIARETKRLIESDLSPIQTAPECRMKLLPIPFQKHWTRDEWERRATEPGVVGYHARKWLDRQNRGETLPLDFAYPVQTWVFGNQLAMVFLGGEVVVDYSIRIKRELNASRLWINAYSNSVPCYIPSRRILAEGGYEAETSLWYYDQPQRLAPETEDLIVKTVHELLPDSFDLPNNEMPPLQTPTEASKSFRLRPGFEIELVASEPLVESPVAIDFGPDGRLWVCEMRDYPSGMDGNGKPGGRIKVLSDSDSDGRFDTAEIWADDLPFPTGLMAWRSGVIVCAAPDIWFITPELDQSTKRLTVTGTAKGSHRKIETRREKLLTGFGVDNFQARVNGLRWGLDGWIHGSGGLFGGKITVLKTGETVDCTNRDFRFKPDTGEFEPLAGVSQQGHVRDDFDQWFGNDNSTLLWHFPLPDRYRRRNSNVPMPPARIARSRDADPGRVFPASQTLDRFNHPESANRITSGCGPEIYRDVLLGTAFNGNAFVCESVHNVVRRAILDPDGVSFMHRRAEGEQQSEFLASTDNWFRPVEVRTGPDGALWVVDMYRFVIEHPKWIPSDRLKSLDIRAGTEHGRIWRITPTGSKPRPVRDLTRLSAAELASAINSPNGPTRDLAHRLLLETAPEHFNAESLPVLLRIAGNTDNPAVRTQALAILSAAQCLDDQLLDSAFRDAAPRVRRFTVSLLDSAKPKNEKPPESLLQLARDEDSAVRYQLALTLGNFAHEATGRTLADLALVDGASEWHRAAILSSLLASPNAFIHRFNSLDKGEANLRALRDGIVTTLASARKTDALAAWIETRFQSIETDFAEAKLTETLHLLAAIAAAPETLNELTTISNSGVALILKKLNERLADKVGQIVADPKASLPNRRLALRLLSENANTDGVRRTELTRLFDSNLPSTLQQALTEALQRQESLDIATSLLSNWQERPPTQRLLILPILLSRNSWTEELLSAMEHSQVSASEFTAAQQQQLREHSDPAIRSRAANLLSSPHTDRTVVIQRYREVAKLQGDSLKGATHFDRLCASCHALSGHGHAVGPDLNYFRAKPVDDFLTAILDPNAAIEPRYAMWTVETKDGQMLAGVAQDESTTTLTLVQPGGNRTTVQREKISRLQPVQASLMPVGLEESLTPQDMADLIAWITMVPAESKTR